MIEVEGLTKLYGEMLAVDDVSLVARGGAITGLSHPRYFVLPSHVYFVYHTRSLMIYLASE